MQRLYEKVFQRTADTAGLNDWSNKLYNGTTTGATTAWNFFFSPEFGNKNTTNEQYVNILYQALFDRNADTDGKANWVSLLDVYKRQGGMTLPTRELLSSLSAERKLTFAQQQEQERNQKIVQDIAENITHGHLQKSKNGTIEFWDEGINEKIEFSNMSAGLKIFTVLQQLISNCLLYTSHTCDMSCSNIHY